MGELLSFFSHNKLRKKNNNLTQKSCKKQSMFIQSLFFFLKCCHKFTKRDYFKFRCWFVSYIPSVIIYNLFRTRMFQANGKMCTMCSTREQRRWTLWQGPVWFSRGQHFLVKSISRSLWSDQSCAPVSRAKYNEQCE